MGCKRLAGRISTPRRIDEPPPLMCGRVDYKNPLDEIGAVRDDGAPPATVRQLIACRGPMVQRR
jgi:hypothetical protein